MLPISRAPETVIWFGHPASAVRLAAHDGVGNLLVYSDDRSGDGSAYTLEFSNGTRLQIWAALTGPGQVGESMVYQGHGLRILSWRTDGSPASVRVVGASGAVLDLELPAGMRTSTAADTQRRRTLADGGVTDPCPALQPGDDSWPDEAAEERSLRHTGCRLTADPLLFGHPTLRLSSEALDWIAERAESISQGITKTLREDLPAAWESAQDLVAKIPARFQQATLRAKETADAVTDSLLVHGIRYSQQLLPSGNQEQLLDWLEDDLRRFKPDVPPEGLQRIDPARMAPPSRNYRPEPAPPLPPKRPAPVPSPPPAPTPPPPVPSAPGPRFSPGVDLPPVTGTLNCRVETQAQRRIEYCENAERHYEGWRRVFAASDSDPTFRLRMQDYYLKGVLIEHALYFWDQPGQHERVNYYRRNNEAGQRLYSFENSLHPIFHLRYETFELPSTRVTTYFTYCPSGELSNYTITAPGQTDQRATLQYPC